MINITSAGDAPSYGYDAGSPDTGRQFEGDPSIRPGPSVV